jgi:hypothetical protein
MLDRSLRLALGETHNEAPGEAHDGTPPGRIPLVGIPGEALGGALRVALGGALDGDLGGAPGWPPCGTLCEALYGTPLCGAPGGALRVTFGESLWIALGDRLCEHQEEP